MLEPLLIIIAVIVLLIASYSDLKTREVPDWLSYGFLFSVLGIRTIFSVEWGWTVLLSGVLGFIAAFLIAYLFYFTEQWGGADSKLLMGIGALLGISYPFNNSSFDLLLFLFSLLFIGAIYGLIWMVVLAVKNFKPFKKMFKKSFKKQKKVYIFAIILTWIILIFLFFMPLLWPLLFFPLPFFFLFLFVSSVEKTCFIVKRDPFKLTEGDWLAQRVKSKNSSITNRRTLRNQDIVELQKLKRHGKLDKVLIKEGIPFVPNFLLAYLLVVFGRDVFDLLVKMFFG